MILLNKEDENMDVKEFIVERVISRFYWQDNNHRLGILIEKIKNAPKEDLDKINKVIARARVRS